MNNNVLFIKLLLIVCLCCYHYICGVDFSILFHFECLLKRIITVIVIVNVLDVNGSLDYRSQYKIQVNVLICMEACLRHGICIYFFLSQQIFLSQNSDFFPQNFDFIKQNCDFVSCSSEKVRIVRYKVRFLTFFNLTFGILIFFLNSKFNSVFFLSLSPWDTNKKVIVFISQFSIFFLQLQVYISQF